jgi:hypothetical protein
MNSQIAVGDLNREQMQTAMAIDSSDYMKERSCNVTPKDISELLVRNNSDGTMTVSLGINKEITLSKEQGNCKIRIEDTGSTVNVHVEVSDFIFENGERREIGFSQTCRLKNFHTCFEPVSPLFSYSPGEIEFLTSGIKDMPNFDVMDGVNFGLNLRSSVKTYKSGYFQYNELWHQTKTRGVAWKFQERWNNPGAKYWRQQQVKPYAGARSAGMIGKASKVLFAADIAMSGEIKPSHYITGGVMALTAATAGVGSVVAVIWFVADFGTMGVNWLIGNGARGLGDIIDESDFGKSITIEMYEGLY